MDQFDTAQQLAQLHQDESIKAHRARISPAVSQLVINGEVLCWDCRDPIEPERLKARPDAFMCVSCQAVQEKYGRR